MSAILNREALCVLLDVNLIDRAIDIMQIDDAPMSGQSTQLGSLGATREPGSLGATDAARASRRGVALNTAAGAELLALALVLFLHAPTFKQAGLLPISSQPAAGDSYSKQRRSFLKQTVSSCEVYSLNAADCSLLSFLRSSRRRELNEVYAYMS